MGLDSNQSPKKNKSKIGSPSKNRQGSGYNDLMIKPTTHFEKFFIRLYFDIIVELDLWKPYIDQLVCYFRKIKRLRQALSYNRCCSLTQSFPQSLSPAQSFKTGQSLKILDIITGSNRLNQCAHAWS